jgi:hypothetical protein
LAPADAVTGAKRSETLDAAHGRVAMNIQEYVVRQQDGLWEVWLGDQLLSGQPTQMEALHVAEALAHKAAVERGERSKVLVRGLDGPPIEFPTIGPRGQPPVEQT